MAFLWNLLQLRGPTCKEVLNHRLSLMNVRERVVRIPPKVQLAYAALGEGNQIASSLLQQLRSLHFSTAPAAGQHPRSSQIKGLSVSGITAYFFNGSYG